MLFTVSRYSESWRVEVDLLCASVAGSPHVLILALRLAGLSLEFKWLDA